MATKQMYSYTKETLLAFASLPSCQTRPDGIDPVIWRDSINSDVVEGSIAIPLVPAARGLARKDSELGGYSKSPVDDIPEWRRPNGGGAILQSGARRKQYEEEPVGNAFSCSYPPRPTGSWGENNGPSRPPFDRPGLGPSAPPGRWDRFGDRDREQRGRPPHDWDGDESGAGGAGEAGHRPWVERDGLLGSGNRPPPQGPPRLARPADNYQPPRPLIKTPVYGRREDTDVVNDETFGSLEASNDERAEQERKRRESFEMMRREQHRQLQEQKQPPTKSETPTVNRKHDENSLWDKISHCSPPHSPIAKTIAPVPPGPTTPRPAVPPGFLKVGQQRLNPNQTPLQQEEDAKGSRGTPVKGALGKEPTVTMDSDHKTDDSSSVHTIGSEAEVQEIKDATPSAKDIIMESEVVNTKVVVTATVGATAGNGTLAAAGSLRGKRLEEGSDLWSFNLEGNHDVGLPSEVISTDDVVSTRKESLLDKLFGNSTPDIIGDVVLANDNLGVESSIIVPEEENWSETNSQTSKFARWFHPQEDKFTTTSETSSPTNIMSLFAKSEPSTTFGTTPYLEEDVQGNGGFGSVRKPGRSILPMPVGPSLEDIEKGMTSFEESASTGNPRIIRSGFPMKSKAAKERPPALPLVFMTCEDIEQALLAEAAGSDEYTVSSRAPPVVCVAETPPKDATSASQHLLALLQKRPVILEAGSSNGSAAADVTIEKRDSEWPWKKPVSSNNQASEVHTLEALFGKAFMSELRSSEAPVPVSSFPEEGFISHKIDGMIPSFPLQSGSKLQASGNGMDTPQNWFASTGPGWNSMWPDSKDVEAGTQQNVGQHYFSEPQMSHPMSPEHDDDLYHIPSAPPISDYWGSTDFNQSHDHVSLDSMNGATASIGGPSFKLALSEGLLDSNRLQNGGMVHSMSSEGGTTSGEVSPVGSTNNRLLSTGEKLSLLTRTNEVNVNIAVPADSSKRFYGSRASPDSTGILKGNSMNGVTRILGQGNDTQFKASAGMTGCNAVPVEGPPQQNNMTLFRPRSPPGQPKHLSAPPPAPRQHQQATHVGANSAFPHPTFGTQPQAPVFNNNVVDFGWDGSGARAFRPPGQGHFQPPPQAFHGLMAHQPPQFLGQPQILQRPPFFGGMGVQEHEGVKHQLPAGVGPLHVPPGHHAHGQHLPVHAPPMGFLAPFNSEFSRAGGKGHGVNGYSGVGNVEKWFGMEGNRPGLSGPTLIPQPPVHVEGDMKMRFG